MSSIDLVILGYLLQGEKSAYEMVKEFENWSISNWVKISNPAIYKNIIKLSSSGYLDSRKVKEGEMPEKKIYEINEQGRRYFHELMESSSSQITDIHFDFSAFIVNLHFLDHDEQQSMLFKFKQAMDLKKKEIDFLYAKEQEANRPESVLLLTELYKNMFELLEHWSSDVLDKYK